MFLIFKKMLSAFHHYVSWWLWVCHKWSLLCWDMFLFLLDQLWWEFLSWMDAEFCQCFYASFEMITWFLSFLLLMCFITLIDLHMLNHLCNPLWINPTWPWCMILSTHCYIWFDTLIKDIEWLIGTKKDPSICCL